MMKLLKAAGLVLAVLVLLLAAAAGVAALFFDGDWAKQELARVVQEKTQRSLTIKGNVALTFLPRLGLRIGQASLSEKQSAEEFAALESARVSVAVLPLLSKRVVVDRLELRGLRLTLVRRKDGSLNAADLSAAGSTDDRRGDGAAGPRLQVAGIRISDSTLTWRDEQSGKTTVVSGLELATGPVESGSTPGSYRLDAVKFSARASSGGDNLLLRLASPEITLDGQRLQIGKLSLESDGSSSGTGFKAKLEAEVSADLERKIYAMSKLEGSLDVSHPRLPMKSLHLPLSGKFGADLGKSTAQLSLATRLDGSPVSLKLDLTRFSPPALVFDLRVDRLDVDHFLPSAQASAPGSTGGSGGSVEMGDKAMDLRGTVHIGLLRFAGIETRDVRLKVSTRDGRLEYSGLVQDVVTAKVKQTLRTKAQEKLQGLLFGK